MGLLKTISSNSGVPLKYHRVISINNVTNILTIIEVASYVNENQREIEKKYQQAQIKNQNNEALTVEEQELLDNGINIYINTKYYYLPYNKDMNVDNAYEYLKTLEEYIDCQNAEEWH